MSPRRKRPSELLAPGEYEKLFEAQRGRCAIRGCGRVPKTRRFHVDHDHKTGKVRGLLCYWHNRLLPAGVTADELIALAEYLGADVWDVRL